MIWNMYALNVPSSMCGGYIHNPYDFDYGWYGEDEA